MSSSGVIDLLIKAGLLISEPEKWTHGALARKAGGTPLLNPAAKSAKSWDVTGAIYAAAQVDPQRPSATSRNMDADLIMAIAAVSRTASRLHRKTPTMINDEGSHERVLELLRATIRYERAQVQSLQS